MVLTDIRGCREVGVHEEHLLLVPASNPARLTEAVSRLLDDPALRARLGDAARERALTHFDQRRVATTSLATYALVADEKDLGW